jgi:thiamine-monophosphate kinase
MEEKKKKLTQLSELGEFLLIDKLTADNKIKNSSTIKGVSDDAAVIKYANDELTLISNDLLVEGIHFDLMYSPLKYVGYKAITENVSDIYAMNGKPEQILVSFAVSNRFTYEALDELYKGIYEACDFYGVDLVGGDVTSSQRGMFLSITVVGKNKKEKISYRNGAKTDDLICVTGDLGAAYMGLQLLEREKKIARETNITPDWSGYEYILQRQLRPIARKDIFEFFEKKNIVPNAMIDISDGLSSEIIHICKLSNKGAIIYEEQLPISEQTAAMAEELGLIPTTAAMNGGEDYELLFTISEDFRDVISENKDIHIIGYITEKTHDINLIANDGTEVPILAQGWNSLQ